MMFSKPFKPLTIRKPVATGETLDHGVPPAKRRKLSPDLHPRAARPQSNEGERQPLKSIVNPPSPVLKLSDNASEGIESYFSILWRVPTNKKNKTWTDDGVLAVRDGFATLYTKSGKSIGRTAFSAPLLPESNLTISGKEVEVDSQISKNAFLEIIGPKSKPPSSEHKAVPKAPSAKPSEVQPSKPSIQSQMKAQIQKEKAQVKKQHLSPVSRVGVFKQPLKESTILPKGMGESPTPRHDPNAEGAIVFKRPRSPPGGRQIVDVVLDPLIGKKLRPHQQEGVKFLYECVMGLRDFDGRGCILADDMGLGKTLTTIALLWTLLRQNPFFRETPVIRKALIVCPVSLIRNWKREFRKWLGSDRLGVLEFEDQQTRLSSFDGKVYQVMIIGYERLRIVADDLAKGQPIDIVICDEGHRLKTMKNKAAQAIESLNTKRRIILSGTPIQNDLGEFFAMVNFVNDGCLGSQKGFSRDFEKPIMRSRQPDALPAEVERGQDASEELTRTTSAFILRRTADILADFLPPKTEYVLFCKPTPAQAKIYRSVVRSPMFHNALRSQETAFQLITILKKLCNSPALMDPNYGNDESTPSSSLITLNEMLPNGLSRLYQNSVSCKIRLLDQLLQQIRTTTDEKVVVISNYTSTLNLIQQLAANSNLSFLRLDGSVAAKKRQALVDKFNHSTAAQCFLFLLSAKAGGVGLNLIGASRLVLFDVDWNPATDDQAVARIYRQGQKRHCRIYRFLIKGGLEERIWQRQVVKRALADSIMQGGSHEATAKTQGGTSSFSQEELKDLFRLDEGDGLRTHDLIDCGCEGAGWDGDCKDETDVALLLGENDKPESDNEDLEVPPLKPKGLSSRKCSASSWTTAKDALSTDTAPIPTELEAEKHQLMQYRHVDTSILTQKDGNSELKGQIMSAIDDECLGHVVTLDPDMIGGGGISYIFKKIKGSQCL
ncbi:SNF2 family domain-containing protein isoform 2 [Cladophialophora immunda]|nr:SNF2 family domain-containing protein isoform 1 [Cladophialophora immunda]OQV11085.1 SNF2 family domain-containing protein isoform 2 [Cladophialophora immunda]